MKLISFFCTLILFFNINYSFAGGVIRDSEIEETLQNIALPLSKAANIKSLKIILIDDDGLNAFTFGGSAIYIYSGLIKQFPDIDVVRGVIAHEIGHILGQHASRQMQNSDLYNKVIASSIAATIGLIGLSKGNAELGIVPALSGLHVAERSMLAHSRTFESSADQTAFKLLEKTGNTNKGMIKFFEYMNNQHRGMDINPYEQTHPLSNDRLSAIRSFYQKSKFKSSRDSSIMLFEFQRSSAKLVAFTSNLKRLDKITKISHNDEINNYFNAIKYFRKSELNKAINYIDALLNVRPTDPFYNELKGQILFDFGNKEALVYYDKACASKPKDILLKLSRAIVGINIYNNQSPELKKYYQDLQEVLHQESDNITALFYLSIYYEKIGALGESLLTKATIALKSNELQRAKKLARTALNILEKNSPAWHRANDIILTE